MLILMKNIMKQLCVIFTALCLVSFMRPAQNKLRIFMAGDSTMQLYDTAKTPQRGWGQLFHEFFNKEVEIHDLARGGRSTKSFIAEGHWDNLLQQLKKDDWVFIEFGHNDHDTRKPERYTPPDQYEKNLIRMVSDVQTKGAHAIILTPIAMHSFDKSGHYHDGHGVYPAKAKDAAARSKVPLIDLDGLFGEVISKMGADSSTSMFMNFGPGLYKAYPDGRKDNTHLRTSGAREVASLAAARLKQLPEV